LEFTDRDRDVLLLDFETNLSSFNGNTFFTSVFTVPSGSGQSHLSCSPVPPSGCSNLGYFSSFNSGSATPLVATPEPSSLVFLGIDVLALLGLFAVARFVPLGRRAS
jgi:hypothetical protein